MDLQRICFMCNRILLTCNSFDGWKWFKTTFLSSEVSTQRVVLETFERNFFETWIIFLEIHFPKGDKCLKNTFSLESGEHTNTRFGTFFYQISHLVWFIAKINQRFLNRFFCKESFHKERSLIPRHSSKKVEIDVRKCPEKDISSALTRLVEESLSDTQMNIFPRQSNQNCLQQCQNWTQQQLW